LNGIISVQRLEPTGRRVEDAVPGVIELGDVLIEPVLTHAVRVHTEKVAAAAAVERIERHVQAVVLRHRVVLTHEVRRDLFRLGVVEPRTDVERIIVVEEVNLAALEGSAYSMGVTWCKLSTSAAPRHSASSSRPSMTGGIAVRTICTLF
jgi:hypothetical protein